MTALRSISLFVAVITLTAGCVGGRGAAPEATDRPIPSAASPAAFSDTTGAVDGLVVSDEQTQLGGADVALVSKDPPFEQRTLTDVTGRFTFSNVPPGHYNVFAQMLGFESATRGVDVRAGEAANLQFVLVAIAVHTGYGDVWMKKGYFECSTTIAGSTGPCGFFPLVGNVTQVADLFNKQGSRAFIYTVGPGVMSEFNEMRWTAGSAATGTKLSLTFSYQNRTTGHWYCNNAGNNPVIARWDRGDPDAPQGKCTIGGERLPGSEPKTIPMQGQELRTFANTGPARNPADGSDISSLGLAWQQSFEMWFSMFYWDAAPDGYTALRDT